MTMYHVLVPSAAREHMKPEISDKPTDCPSTACQSCQHECPGYWDVTSWTLPDSTLNCLKAAWLPNNCAAGYLQSFCPSSLCFTTYSAVSYNSCQLVGQLCFYKMCFYKELIVVQQTDWFISLPGLTGADWISTNGGPPQDLDHPHSPHSVWYVHPPCVPFPWGTMETI